MATAASTHLAAVDAAITALLGGAASYSIGGRSVTHHDLGQLFEIRDKLMKQVTREGTGGMFKLAKMQKPKS